MLHYFFCIKKYTSTIFHFYYDDESLIVYDIRSNQCYVNLIIIKIESLEITGQY